MRSSVEHSSKDHSLNGEGKESPFKGTGNAQRLDEMSKNEIERAVETQNKLMEEFSFDLKDYFGGPSVEDLDASCNDQRLRNLFNEVQFTDQDNSRGQEAKKGAGLMGYQNKKQDNHNVSPVNQQSNGLSFKMAQESWTLGQLNSYGAQVYELPGEFRGNLIRQPTPTNAFSLSKKQEREQLRACNPSHSPDTRTLAQERPGMKKPHQQQFPLSKSLSSQTRFLIGASDPVNIHHSYLSSGSNKSENEEDTNRIESDFASTPQGIIRQQAFKSATGNMENVYTNVKASGVSLSATSLSKGHMVNQKEKTLGEDPDFEKQENDPEEDPDSSGRESKFIEDFVTEALRNMPLSKITKVLIDLFRIHRDEFYIFHKDFISTQDASLNPMETRETTTANPFHQTKLAQQRNVGILIGSTDFGIQNTVPTPKNGNNSSEDFKKRGIRNYVAKMDKGAQGSDGYMGSLHEKTNPSRSPDRGEFLSTKISSLTAQGISGQPSSRGVTSSGVSSKFSQQNTGYGIGLKLSGKEKKAAKDYASTNNIMETKSSRKNKQTENQRVIDRKLIERAHQAKKSSVSSSSFMFPSNLSGNGGAATPRSKEKQELNGKSNQAIQVLSPKTSSQYHSTGSISQSGHHAPISANVFQPSGSSANFILSNLSHLVHQNGSENYQGAQYQSGNTSIGAQYYQAFQRKYMGTGAGGFGEGSKGVNPTQLALARYKNSRKESSNDKKYEIFNGVSYKNPI